MNFDRFAQWGTSRRGWSGMTPGKYRWWAQRADRELDVPLARARIDHLLAWYDRLPDTASTRNQAVYALRGFYAWQLEEGRRTTNPADELPTMRRRKALPKAYTKGQTAKLLTAAAERGQRWECYVALLFRTGLRKEESRTLRWTQWEGDYLRVTGKGARDRDVPVPDSLTPVLTAWRRMCRDRTWVYPSPRQGGPMSRSWIALTLGEIGDAAGLAGFTPHVARHSYATRLRELGVDIREIAELLGHASISTTEIYQHVRPPRLRDAVNLLDL